MELYKRKVGHVDIIGRDSLLDITSTTLNFQFFLTQNIYDVGIYTDVNNQDTEILRLFPSQFNLTAETTTVQNCTVTNNCNVTFNATPISYPGATNGALQTTISNCTPATISWTGPNNYTAGNQQTVSNLGAGSYTIKIVDTDCNTSYATYFLQQPATLSLTLLAQNSQTNALIGCNGSANAIAQGGTPPYRYTWYSGTTVIAGPSSSITGLTSLCQGQYNVQIVDSAQPPVTITQYFNITGPSSISGNVTTTTNISCYNGTNGSMTMVVNGGMPVPNGYKITITNGSTIKTLTGITNSATFEDLPYGTYTVQIMDSVGNTGSISSVTLTQPTQLTLNYNKTNVTCYDNRDGSVILTPGGGTPPYDINIYKNSNILTGAVNVTTPQTFSSLDVGNYAIQIKDVNNCTIPNQSFTIQQRPILNLSVNTLPTTNGYNIPCYGNTTTVYVNTSYSYDTTTYTVANNPIKYYVNDVLKTTVTGPSSTVALTNMLAGNYTIRAEDSAGCESDDKIITITQPSMPLTVNYGIIKGITASTGVILLTGGSATVLTGSTNIRQGIIDINGGVYPYTITWSDGSTLLTSNTQPVGTNLTVSVTDNNGCSVGPINITLT
jgi:hypothetical protein